MPRLTRSQRRINRKHVLAALRDETGSLGGDSAAPRVQAYLQDPTGASSYDYGFVGGLDLGKFYLDQAKPNVNDRSLLWQRITTSMGKKGAADPGRWARKTKVLTLHAIAEEA